MLQAELRLNVITEEIVSRYGISFTEGDVRANRSPLLTAAWMVPMLM